MKLNHLYETLQPKHYKIHVTPDIDSLTFKARATITARVKKQSHSITLHARGLQVISATVNGESTTHEYNKTTEELRITTEANLTTDTDSTIEIEYKGTIDQNSHGLYISTYKDGGKDKKMLATQFESIHARMFVPCVDEPEAKATFQLTVTAPIDMTVVSNTDVASVDKSDTTQTVAFNTTPKMSTYLLALIIGDLGYVEESTKRGVLVRTYAAKDQLEFAKNSTKMAADVLDFYEEYFQIPYPLEILNQIALPDVEAGVGAMENWGCVTYRADALLINPEQTSRDMLTYNAVVIAHELAHQWFGNLVTMKWWDELWLNEGFAAFIEYLAIDHIKPEWDVWEEFLSNDYSSARKKDAMRHTHAVRTDIHHPKEIAEVFDDITYRKGSSSIRMLWHYLGEEDFRLGLSAYLKDHSYGNATSEDLWAALEKQSGKKVKGFMDAWTKQEGHPIVTIEPATDSIDIVQQRFSLSDVSSDDTWPIPIQVGETVEIFDTKKKSLPKNTNLLLNKDGGGFYRIGYTANQVSEISHLKSFSDLDRINILSDISDQVITGAIRSTEMLELLLTFSETEKSGVWDILAANLSSLLRVFSHQEIYDNLQPYGQKLLEHHYSKLKWDIDDRESHNDALRRLTILGLARTCNVGDAREQAAELFSKVQTGESIHQDLRPYAYIQGIRDNETDNYEWYKQQYIQTEHSEEQRRLASAMCSVKSNALMDQSLEFMMSDNVRNQDGYVWLLYGLRNRHQKKRVWEFIKNNWDWLYANYGHSIALSSIVTSFGAAFADKDIAKDIASFFKDKDTAGFSRSIDKATEIIGFQSEWHARDYEAVLKYFDPR